MAVKIAPDARRQFVNASGVPYSGAKLFYYAAGSTTKQNTYTTSTGATPNSNPIILDSAGRTPYGVWMTAGLTYKEVLAPSTDTDPPGSPIFTEDNLSGVNDTSVTVSQWAASALTPTYVNATQFTVAGDQTSELHVGRRLQLSVTAGTVYGRISVSAYGALTTITLVMDSGTLDSGLSSFNWSILTATNPAIPKLATAALTDLGIADTTALALKAPLASPVFTGVVDLSATVLKGASPLAFDGATAGTNKTTFAVTDPTGNRTITVPDADVDLTKVRAASTTLDGVSRFATTAEAVAESTAQVITPGAVKYCPGVAKAWIVFNGTGIPALISGINVSGTITDNGVGNYTINFTNNFSSASYCVTGMAEDDNTSGGCKLTRWAGDTRSTSACQVRVFSDAGSAVDSAYICVAFFGAF